MRPRPHARHPRHRVCGDGDELTVFVGDLRVDVATDVEGTPLDMTLHFSLSVGFEVVPDGDSVGIELTEVKTADWDAVVAQDDMLAWADLVSNVVADHALPEVLAALDTSKTVNLTLPTISSQGIGKSLVVDTIERIGGATVVGGTLQ